MSNDKHKANNKENKRNDVNRPTQNKGDKNIPPKYNDFEGNPIK